MTPTEIANHTHVFTAPEEWDEEANGRCTDLYARVQDDISSSAWKPSPEELRKLMQGGNVVVHVYTSQPAIAVSVE